jgi:RNA polymerase sigma factor (sigma-70 family)
MSTSTLGLFLRHLALSEEVSRLGTASDHDLLAAYEPGRGQAAFAELMRRYGPMVLRTCRRVLGQETDAEDAFQATFVLLARKAGSISKREALGGWLHRVAYRTALKALAGKIRRRVRERQVCVMSRPDPDPSAKATWNEVRPILDAELDALPDEARRLLIACYLQDKTHAEAAVELGLPRGSVAWRLEQARSLLAERLARRGIMVSAALLAVLLAETAKGAGVPAVLLVHTLEAARTFTEQATGVLSDHVAQLVKGGLAQMTKGSTRLSVALAGWVSLLGAGLIACQTLKAWPERTPPSEPAAAERPAREEKKQTQTDRYGDPLPPGALARLGTTRFRGVASGQMSVVFTRDGKGVITAGLESSARLWEVSTGKLIRQFGDLSRQRVHTVALSPNGRILAGRGGADGGLRLWDIASGKLLAEGKGESADLVSLAYSPDGKRVASGGNDNKLRLWDAVTGQEQWVQNSATGAVFAVAFSPDGKNLAAVETKTISFWDAATGKRESRRWKQERFLSSAAFLPDGRTLAVACGSLPRAKERESVVCLVDVAECKGVRQLAPEKGEQGITALAVAPDGKILATAGEYGGVRLWDVDTGKELRRCQGARSFPNALTFSVDGKMLAGMDRGVVRLWETASGKEMSSARGGHKQLVSSVAFAPDGATVVSGSWDGSIRVWDTATGQQQRQVLPVSDELQVGACMTTEISRDGKTLASAHLVAGSKPTSAAVLIRLWDGDTTREPRSCFKDFGGLPLWFAFSADVKTVASIAWTAAPGKLHLWEAATGKELSRIAGVDGHPALSPDGKLLAAVPTEGRPDPSGPVTLWEAATAKKLCTLPTPQGHVQRLLFSPDGRMLAATSDGSRLGATTHVHLWPLIRDESRPAAMRPGPPRLLGEEFPYDRIWVLAFSPDGRMLALAGTDGTVRVLETASGKERTRFTGHGGDVTALSFAADGRRLASGSRDTTILIWDVTGRLQSGHLQPMAGSLRHSELEKLWADLVADDARRAGRAIWTLAADPARTVPFLAKRLRPASVRVAPETIAKLIRDLDDDTFAVRVKARQELRKLGVVAEPALRQALEKAASVEVRRRLEELLAAVAEQEKCPSGEVLRGLRAVEALEQIGTREAQQVLQTLTAGAPASPLTREAHVALDRLERTEKR